MSFGIGLEDLIFTIQESTRIYDKITPPSDQLDDVQNRLNQILVWLIPIDRHLTTKYGPSNYYPESPTLKTTVDTMTTSANEILQIFQHFHIAARTDDSFSHLRTIRFAAGNSSKHLSTLLTTLERSTTSLDRQVTTMDRRYLQGHPIKVRPKPPLHTFTKIHSGLRILFIDDHNTSRSILAQGYAQLLRDFTIRAQQPWHISTIHSSGLYIRDTSQSGLSILQDRLNLPPSPPPGNTPNPTALTTLLTHATPPTHPPYKRTLTRQLRTQMSRGLSNTTFNTYDYIFVFSFRDNVSLQKLKAMVRRTYGAYAAPKGKARIVMLGEYAGKGATSEILGVGGEGVLDEVVERREWEKVMTRIRVGFRAWLREELGWVRPVEMGV